MHPPKPCRLRRPDQSVARVLLLFFLSFPVALAGAEQDRGLLWEISRPGVPASYLFGTIHSEDPGVLQLAAPVQQAFDASQAVVLEVLLDMNAMMLSSAAMLLMVSSIPKQAA